MFDQVEIIVRAGGGGNGVVSFRREKFIPLGGPNGGDGGDGGDVVIVADPSLSGLREFTRRRFYRAANGEHGKGQRKHGKRGENLILRVPVGTVTWDKASPDGKALIADLEGPGQKVVVASGGQGGWGNTHFVSSTNQAPRLAQRGEAGEEKSLILELRLIADVGIIGYPNVGKSTLLAAASAAKPKVASYPFTTLEPILGVVEVGHSSLILAEIPGIVAEAHLGRGLGHDFLRHIMRTKMLIHLIDGASVSPVEDMVRVNAELGLFDATLAQKPQLAVVNKVDLPSVQARLAEIKDAFTNAGTDVLFVSAASGEGVPQLMAEAMKRLGQLTAEEGRGSKVPPVVFRPQPGGGTVSVHREGDTLVVIAPRLERIIALVDLTNAEVRWQLKKQLTRTGADKALQKAGVKPGDKVRCGHYQWEW